MPDVDAGHLDSGCYVYGVVPATPVTSLVTSGLDDAPVEFVDFGELAAAVSEIAIERPPGRRAELLAHSAVVDALAMATTVVPVQFGSILADRDQVRTDLLEAHYEDFTRLLAGLRDTVQFTLRATYVHDQVLAEVVQSRPDIAELRRRTKSLPEGTLHPDLVRLGELVSGALEARSAEDADDILDVVHPLVLAESVRSHGGTDHVVEVALLVAQDGIPELEDALETQAEAIHERIRMSLTGPTAPYDFVGELSWA